LDNYIEIFNLIVQIWTMIKSSSEILQELAGRIRARRVTLGWPQLEAAQRAGVAYRTWRRLETEGQASLEDMVKAALALRCEEALDRLFPLPAAASLDALLKQQHSQAVKRPARVRASRPRTPRAPHP
jgi:transcriptional regulator with XRE-family HTH domain